MIQVSIVYSASPECSLVEMKLSLPEEATVSDAIRVSKLLQTHPEVSSLAIGIFSKLVGKDHPLEPGDRIEIYRSLKQDPKMARRRRHQPKRS